MEQISFNLEKYKQPKKACTYFWQEKALEAISYLDNPVKSEVFKWYKLRESKIETSLRYMKERKIKNFFYLAKLMSL